MYRKIKSYHFEVGYFNENDTWIKIQKYEKKEDAAIHADSLKRTTIQQIRTFEDNHEMARGCLDMIREALGLPVNTAVPPMCYDDVIRRLRAERDEFEKFYQAIVRRHIGYQKDSGCPTPESPDQAMDDLIGEAIEIGSLEAPKHTPKFIKYLKPTPEVKEEVKEFSKKNMVSPFRSSKEF